MLSYKTTGLFLETISREGFLEQSDAPLIPVRFGTGLFEAQYRVVSRMESGSAGSMLKCVFERHSSGAVEDNAATRELLDKSTLSLRVAGKEYAVKMTSLLGLGDVQRMRVVKEYRRLARLQHANVVPLLEVIHDGDHIYLIMELIEAGSLYNFICRHSVDGRLSETDAFVILKQVVDGLSHLHRLDVVHRDIKLENILVDFSGHVYLCDFGLSTRIVPERGRRFRASCGTLFFASPEMLCSKPYSGPEVDVWSLGVVFFMLVFGVLPFYSADDAKCAELITQGAFHFPDYVIVSPELKELIASMLVVNAEKRATLRQVQMSAWYRDMLRWFAGLHDVMSAQQPAQEKRDAGVRGVAALSMRQVQQMTGLTHEQRSFLECSAFRLVSNEGEEDSDETTSDEEEEEEEEEEENDEKGEEICKGKERGEAMSESDGEARRAGKADDDQSEMDWEGKDEGTRGKSESPAAGTKKKAKCARCSGSSGSSEEYVKREIDDGDEDMDESSPRGGGGGGGGARLKLSLPRFARKIRQKVAPRRTSPGESDRDEACSAMREICDNRNLSMSVATGSLCAFPISQSSLLTSTSGSQNTQLHAARSVSDDEGRERKRRRPVRRSRKQRDLFASSSEVL